LTTVLVAAAGALGAVLRYRIGIAVGVRAFPWATLTINIAGAFALALFLATSLPSRWGSPATAAIAAGLLGSFTTFSTFGYETLTLLREDRLTAAAVYVGATMVVGLAAAAAGYAIGRAL